MGFCPLGKPVIPRMSLTGHPKAGRLGDGHAGTPLPCLLWGDFLLKEGWGGTTDYVDCRKPGPRVRKDPADREKEGFA